MKNRVSFINDWWGICHPSLGTGWNLTLFHVGYIHMSADLAEIGDVNINGLCVIVLGFGIRVRL